MKEKEKQQDNGVGRLAAALVFIALFAGLFIPTGTIQTVKHGSTTETYLGIAYLIALAVSFIKAME